MIHLLFILRCFAAAATIIRRNMGILRAEPTRQLWVLVALFAFASHSAARATRVRSESPVLDVAGLMSCCGVLLSIAGALPK